MLGLGCRGSGGGARSGLPLAIGQPARRRGGGLPLCFRIVTRGGLLAAAVAAGPVRLAIARNEFRPHPTEEIVHEALRHRDVGVLRVAPRLEPGV